MHPDVSKQQQYLGCFVLLNATLLQTFLHAELMTGQLTCSCPGLRNLSAQATKCQGSSKIEHFASLWHQLCIEDHATYSSTSKESLPLKAAALLCTGKE